MSRKVGLLIELVASAVALMLGVRSYVSGVTCDWTGAGLHGAMALGVLLVAFGLIQSLPRSVGQTSAFDSASRGGWPRRGQHS